MIVKINRVTKLIKNCLEFIIFLYHGRFFRYGMSLDFLSKGQKQQQGRIRFIDIGQYHLYNVNNLRILVEVDLFRILQFNPLEREKHQMSLYIVYNRNEFIDIGQCYS